MQVLKTSKRDYKAQNVDHDKPIHDMTYDDRQGAEERKQKHD